MTGHGDLKSLVVKGNENQDYLTSKFGHSQSLAAPTKKFSAPGQSKPSSAPSAPAFSKTSSDSFLKYLTEDPKTEYEDVQCRGVNGDGYPEDPQCHSASSSRFATSVQSKASSAASSSAFPKAVCHLDITEDEDSMMSYEDQSDATNQSGSRDYFSNNFENSQSHSATSKKFATSAKLKSSSAGSGSAHNAFSKSSSQSWAKSQSPVPSPPVFEIPDDIDPANYDPDTFKQGDYCGQDGDSKMDYVDHEANGYKDDYSSYFTHSKSYSAPTKKFPTSKASTSAATGSAYSSSKAAGQSCAIDECDFELKYEDNSNTDCEEYSKDSSFQQHFEQSAPSKRVKTSLPSTSAGTGLALKQSLLHKKSLSLPKPYPAFKNETEDTASSFSFLKKDLPAKKGRGRPRKNPPKEKKQTTDQQPGLKCNICHEYGFGVRMVTTPCGHACHTPCMMTWLQSESQIIKFMKNCPTCGVEFRQAAMNPVLT